MEHTITNGLLMQGWATVVEILQNPQVYIGRKDRTWDHHFTGGSQQYGGWDSWDLQGREGGGISTEHGMITTRAKRPNIWT